MECQTCRRPHKKLISCGICESSICRDCAIARPEGAFALAPSVAPEHQHPWYCQPCFDSQVEPACEEDRALVLKAREIAWVPKGYRGQINVQKRALTPTEIQGCEDRELARMKMAYLAARDGFNAVIQAEIDHEKKRNEGYQTTRWSARGWLAKVIIKNDLGEFEVGPERVR